MNEIFDVNRFWKYLKYDFTRSVREHGIQLASMVLAPYAIYIVFGLFNVVIGNGWYDNSDVYRSLLFVMMSVTFLIIFPSRVYGFITEKKPMTNWIMVPASVTEKFCSMMVLILVVFPAVFFIGYALVDYIFYLVDPAATMFVVPSMRDVDEATGSVITGFGKFILSTFTLVNSILPFLLGALVFKKNKVAKTILSLIAISSVMGSLLIGFVWLCDNLFNLGSFFASMEAMDVKWIEFIVNLVLYVGTIVPALVLGALVFFRVKTIKP